MQYPKAKILIKFNDEELMNILKDDFIIENDAESYDDYSLLIFDKTNPAVFEYISYLKLKYQMPIAMVFEIEDDYLMKRAYSYGVDEVITKPYHKTLIKLRMHYLINKYHKAYVLKERVELLKSDNLKTNEMMTIITQEMFKYHQSDTAKHMHNIKNLTYELLKAMQVDDKAITDEYIQIVSYGAYFHDIGKIGIDDAVINAKRKLSEEEKMLVRQHPIIGEKIFERLLDHHNQTIILEWMGICRWHHERIDGRGYPDGLSGDLIPLSAQIVGLVDAYEALMAKRVYKKAMSGKEALKMIRNGECGAFEPKLIDYLEKIQNKFSIEL